MLRSLRLLRSGGAAAAATGLCAAQLMPSANETALCFSWGGGGGSAAAAPKPPPPPPAPPPAPLGLPGLPDVTGLQLQMAGVSGLTGYTAGFAVKRTFKVFVFTSGCIFLGLQCLANNGLIDVHWDRIQQRINGLADLNHDGLVDGRDLQSAQDDLQAYLSAGLPSAGAFSAAFLLGLRS